MSRSNFGVVLLLLLVVVVTWNYVAGRGGGGGGSNITSNVHPVSWTADEQDRYIQAMTTGDMAGLYSPAEAECQIQQLEQYGFTFADSTVGGDGVIATSHRVSDPDGQGGDDFSRISRYCAASG